MIVTITGITSSNNVFTDIEITVEGLTEYVASELFAKLFPGVPMVIGTKIDIVSMISWRTPSAPTPCSTLPMVARIPILTPAEKPKAACNCMQAYGHAKWCNAGDWV